MSGNRALTIFAAVLAACAFCRAAVAQPAPSAENKPGPTSAQVAAALDKAKAYLYKNLNEHGNWERVPKRQPKQRFGSEVTGPQWGGQTALAVLALLVAGEDPQDKRIAPAIEFLLKADLVGTYALGVRCQVLLLLPPTKENKALMRRDLQRLIGLMKKTGRAKGFYDYDGEGSSYSLSRAQYAVLGVWAAAQSGEEVPGDYWSQVEKAWVEAQEADGAWRYWPKDNKVPATAGITAVGIATLFIVADELYGNRNINCSQPTEIPAIDKGIAWMVKNFDRVAPASKMDREYPQSNLYAVERVGVAGGLKYFGKIDWYKFGADYLVKNQQKDGSWRGGHSNHADACFGIIFLSRGRAPVIFNKLDWVGADNKSAGGAWNRRPREIANVTRWIGRSIERDFNWQVMTLDAPAADWHDAPVMYLAGADPMKIGKEHVAKLRRYAEDGGLILIHADCGKGGFIGSARKLAAELFPAYPMRELPEAHPLYTTLYPRSKWKNKPSVLGASNGVRELVLLIPSADPGKAWQIGSSRRNEEPWQLAANIVFYAADQKDLKFKGETYLVEDDPAAKTDKSIKLARLRYKGAWDPEAGGWRRMRNLLRRDDKLDLDVQPVDLGTGSLDGFAAAHLTGTAKLKLDEPAIAQLKQFVAGGGTLIVDAAGGAEPFASSVEAEMVSLGTGANLDVLPAEHSLFGGKDGVRVAYRPFARKTVGGLNAPRLKAVRIEDRLAILFSREDLSAGMLGTSTGGIVGYDAETATQIMRRILLRTAGVDAPAPKPEAPKPQAPAGKTKPPAGKKPPKDDNSGFD